MRPVLPWNQSRTAHHRNRRRPTSGLWWDRRDANVLDKKKSGRVRPHFPGYTPRPRVASPRNTRVKIVQRNTAPQHDAGRQRAHVSRGQKCSVRQERKCPSSPRQGRGREPQPVSRATAGPERPGIGGETGGLFPLPPTLCWGHGPGAQAREEGRAIGFGKEEVNCVYQ